jgi:hypothetical protein
VFIRGYGNSDPVWSRDGRTILFIEGATLFLIDPDGRSRHAIAGEPPRTLPTAASHGRQPHGRNGRQIFFLGDAPAATTPRSLP